MLSQTRLHVLSCWYLRLLRLYSIVFILVPPFLALQCDRCQPLYNNKPFRHGDKSDAYACAKCECNNHADSCYYNQTLDPSPGTRDAGGGGVCVGCKHNTTGRHCETCSATFYRENGKDPKAADVCKPCACAGAGVRPGMDDCAKVTRASHHSGGGRAARGVASGWDGRGNGCGNVMLLTIPLWGWACGKRGCFGVGWVGERLR